MQVRENLKRGTVEMVLLHLLLERNMYGYEILQEMKKRSNDKFFLKDGSMYPILYRMIDKGLIEDEQVLVGRRRTRVYYHITEAGKKYLEDTITAQIKSTVGNSKVYEYTVKEYADYLFAHKENNAEFAKAAELIEAMVNYGSYAQIYAGYNTENLAVGDAKNLKSLDDVLISEYYEPSIYETKVQFAGANLSLLSTTTLRMYFQIINVEANEVQFGYQGQLLEMKQSGDYYYVELVGIPASKLDDKFCIDVYDGSTNFQVIYSPMAYCTSVVTRATTETRTEDLKNLIKALVLYNQAADAYISED